MHRILATLAGLGYVEHLQARTVMLFDTPPSTESGPHRDERLAMEA